MSLTGEDPAEINSRKDALNASFHKVSEAMYQRAQEQGLALRTSMVMERPPTARRTAEEEDVVDAEVVDEGK